MRGVQVDSTVCVWGDVCYRRLRGETRCVHARCSERIVPGCGVRGNGGLQNLDFLEIW